MWMPIVIDKESSVGWQELSLLLVPNGDAHDGLFDNETFENVVAQSELRLWT
jgi:hypothetical protein